MLRSVKYIFWLLALMAGAQSSFGFGLIGDTAVAGTSDAYQVAQIGYNLGTDEGTPKYLHEGYRRNMPVVYWSVDTSFWEYFNTNGVDALDQAFAMYNRVGKVSQLDINDYPEDSRRPNFRAQAFDLIDVKSFVMGLMSKQVGLFEPSRWVWTLTGRQLPNPPTCPLGVSYTIEQRNFSITPVSVNEFPVSSYVNGVLYSYFIDETCGPGNPFADAIEFPVDPLSQPYSAVADYLTPDYIGLLPGVFYTSLTRDDVAGLKYIYATNNMATEAAGRRVTEFVTNDISQAQIVTTQDLSTLAAASKTSTAAQLQAQFPGLQVLSTSNYFGFQITTNITETLVNSPIDPAGAPPSHPVITTNFTTNVVQFFTHTFGNIVTNTYATRGIVGTVTQTITNSPAAPAGFPPTTNTVVKLTPQAGVFGDFFILPTNTCSALILSNMLTTVTPTTNLPVVTSNTAASGAVTITFTPGTVTFPTNHIVIFLPVTCPVNAVGFRGGVDRIQFVARFYDSITSQLWDPVTNDYAMLELTDATNGVMQLRHFQRRVPRPDILFSTGNFSSQNSVVTYSNTVDNTTEFFTLTSTGFGVGLGFNTFAYDATGRPGNQAGPGTIIDDDPLPTLYILSRQFPIFENVQASGTIFTTGAAQVQVGGWASFDGTTNAPVVYPNGTALGQLEDLMFAPAPATPTLPDGNIGQAYAAQLLGKNGTAPYTWSLAPNSPALPDGLNISPDGTISGVPSGPTAIYDFTLRITDSAGKFRDVQYTITVF